MNEERTYGVELEMHLTSTPIGTPDYAISSDQRRYLAGRITEAMQAEGFVHFAYSAGSWSEQTDSSNQNKWTVKTDGSLNPSPFATTHPHGTEITSPVLRGPEGLRAIELVCKTVEPYVKVSKKCGLHVHHGVLSNEIAPLMNRWLQIEELVFKALPESRRENRYCKRLGRNGYRVSKPSLTLNDFDLRSWHSRNVQDMHDRHGSRYAALNIKSFWRRGTVEFRCAAGTVEAQKVCQWVLFTQGLLEKTDIPVEEIADIDKLVEWYRGDLEQRAQPELMQETEDWEELESVLGLEPEPVVANTDPRTWYPTTRFMHHQRGSMSADIDQLLVDGIWLDDLVYRIAGNHNRNHAQARNKVLTHINYLREHGVRVEQLQQSGRNRFYQVLPPGDTTTPVVPQARPRRTTTATPPPRREPVIVQTNALDADYVGAALWLKHRYEQFNRPRANVEPTLRAVEW